MRLSYSPRGALSDIEIQLHMSNSEGKQRYVQNATEFSFRKCRTVERRWVDNRRDISKFKLKIALILKTPRTFFTHVIKLEKGVRRFWNPGCFSVVFWKLHTGETPTVRRKKRPYPTYKEWPKAVFYNVGVSPYPWCFEKKNTTDSKKAHFITLKNGVRGVSKTPRSQKSVVFWSKTPRTFKSSVVFQSSVMFQNLSCLLDVTIVVSSIITDIRAIVRRQWWASCYTHVITFFVVWFDPFLFIKWVRMKAKWSLTVLDSAISFIFGTDNEVRGHLRKFEVWSTIAMTIGAEEIVGVISI